MILSKFRLAFTCSVSAALGMFLLSPAQLSVAYADDFNKRAYVGIGAGITRVEPESSTDALTISDNSDTGAHLEIGYDINRFLTVEAYAATLGTAEVAFLGTDVGSVDYTVYGASLLGYFLNSRSGLVFGDENIDGLYRREGASLYGRIGIGHMVNDSDRVDYRRDHPNHAAFGLGLEYGFSNGFAVRTELMAMDTDAKYLNVGILKRFGDASSAPLAAAVIPAVAALAAPEEVPTQAPVAVVENKEFKPIQAPTSYFAFDQSDLTPQYKQSLDEFVVLMQENTLQMQVEGHTDWIAPEAYNMSLSVRRAEAVANYIVSKGISRDRITTVGYGETRPISSNNTAEGRAQNRRTEIQLM